MTSHHRKLVLMRHGEAEGGGAARDFERVLTAAGRNAVQGVGALLNVHGHHGVILASNSVRTKTTADLVAQAWQPKEPPKFYSSLYLGGLDSLTEILEKLPCEVHAVVAIGHNPGFSDAAYALTRKPMSLAPGDAAILNFDGRRSWGEALREEGAWELLEIIRAELAVNSPTRG